MQSGISPFGKKAEIKVYGNETLFRELGYYILRNELYEKSMKVFDEAIKNTPDDIRALVGRSRARAQTSHYKGALEDINKALQYEPDNLTLLSQKALHTYLSCEFESGLVQNCRALPKRQKPDDFLLGVMHCTNAIDTCLGEHAGRPLRDHFEIIRELAWKKNRKVLNSNTEQSKRRKSVRPFFVDHATDNIPSVINRKGKKTKRKTPHESLIDVRESLYSHKPEESNVPPLPEEFPFRPLQNYTSNIENFMAEKYLGTMYHDKKFLKKISQCRPGVSCPNEKSTQKIKSLAVKGFRMVAYKQELLRTRRPFYHIKYKEGTSTVNLKIRRAQELYMQQETTRREADMLLVKFRYHYKERNFRNMLAVGEKLRMFCDSKPKRLLPNRKKYYEELFSTIRKGYYQLFRLNENQYPWDQIKRIQISFGIPVSRDPSTDSVVEEIKPVFTVDNRKQLHILEERMKEPEQSNDETCWCFYEMCKHSTELKNYDIAKIYGKQCIREAKRTENLEWVLIATMLLVRIHLELHNKSDARLELAKAEQVAEELANENLKRYLARCLEVIHRVDLDMESQAAEFREKKIIALMRSVTLKSEFSHLFRAMATMPASRRMTIIPGSGLTSSVETGKRRPSPRRKSVAQSNKSSRSEDVSEQYIEKIRKKKEENVKGIEFMKLIQYHID